MRLCTRNLPGFWSPRRPTAQPTWSVCAWRKKLPKVGSLRERWSDWWRPSVICPLSLRKSSRSSGRKTATTTKLSTRMSWMPRSSFARGIWLGACISRSSSSYFKNYLFFTLFNKLGEIEHEKTQEDLKHSYIILNFKLGHVSDLTLLWSQKWGKK